MRNPYKLTTFVLAAVLAVVVGSSAINTAEADKQPLMQSALKSLEDAKASLSKATHDKGGHRVKAIGHLDNAISEVKKGIAFDHKH